MIIRVKDGLNKRHQSPIVGPDWERSWSIFPTSFLSTGPHLLRHNLLVFLGSYGAILGWLKRDMVCETWLASKMVYNDFFGFGSGSRRKGNFGGCDDRDQNSKNRKLLQNLRKIHVNLTLVCKRLQNPQKPILRAWIGWLLVGGGARRLVSGQTPFSFDPRKHEFGENGVSDSGDGESFWPRFLGARILDVGVLLRFQGTRQEEPKVDLASTRSGFLVTSGRRSFRRWKRVFEVGVVPIFF